MKGHSTSRCDRYLNVLVPRMLKLFIHYRKHSRSLNCLFIFYEPSHAVSLARHMQRQIAHNKMTYVIGPNKCPRKK